MATHKGKNRGECALSTLVIASLALGQPLLTSAAPLSNVGIGGFCGETGYGCAEATANNGANASSDRAEETQRRGSADQQQARDAKDVAGKLEGDKGQALSAYNNPALSQEAKTNFAQRPYQLERELVRKYTSLSQERLNRTGSSLPRLPSNNQQLFSYDTSPLKEYQQSKEQEAANFFRQADEARQAAARLTQMKQESGRRYQAMNSIGNEGSAALPARRGLGSIEDGLADPKFRDAGNGSAQGQKLGKPSANEQSEITRSAERPLMLGRGLKPLAGGSSVTKGKDTQLKGKDKTKEGADSALARMEAAKQLLQKKEAEQAEADKPKTGAETAIQQLTLAGGSSSGTGALGIVPAEKIPDVASLGASPSERSSGLQAAPSELAAESIFALVSRQYMKRARELQQAVNP